MRMNFIADHWQLVFGGIGTAVVAAIVAAWARAHFEKSKATKASQEVRSGDHSRIIQAGRDAKIGTDNNRPNK
jgi:hypothetical protein